MWSSCKKKISIKFEILVPGFFTGPSGGSSTEESGAGAEPGEAEPPKDKPTTGGGAKMPDPDLDWIRLSKLAKLFSWVSLTKMGNL